MATLQQAWAETAGTVADRLAAMQARTVPSPRAVAWGDVRRLALAQMRWAYIVLRARQTPTIPPATATDAAILAAINLVAMTDDQIIDPADAGHINAFRDGLTALVTVGDISAALRVAILALFTGTKPEFPDVGLPDLHAAGLITAAEAGVGG